MPPLINLHSVFDLVMADTGFLQTIMVLVHVQPFLYIIGLMPSSFLLLSVSNGFLSADI